MYHLFNLRTKYSNVENVNMNSVDARSKKTFSLTRMVLSENPIDYDSANFFDGLTEEDYDYYFPNMQYVVAIYKPKRHYEISGPFFCPTEAERKATYHTAEYYDSRYFKEVLIITVPKETEMCKLDVEQWSTMYETRVFSLDGKLVEE